jgi:hypothetical protein
MFPKVEAHFSLAQQLLPLLHGIARVVYCGEMPVILVVRIKQLMQVYDQYYLEVLCSVLIPFKYRMCTNFLC